MEVQGKYGIRAKVLLRSRSSVTGIEFVTYEIEYPRIILAELNTHRMLSKNSASSRAIPFQKMLSQLHGRPVRFGQTNPGMQDKGEAHSANVIIPRHLWQAFNEYRWDWVQGQTLRDCITINAEGKDEVQVSPETAWEFNKYLTVGMSKAFFDAGFHKQVYNRLTESSQMMKTVISGTEWANFLWLRDHEHADPTLHELARVMREAYAGSEVQELKPGEWHLPYLKTMRSTNGELWYFDEVQHQDGWQDIEVYELEDAIKISCARCAAVSFRNVDYTLEKSNEVYNRLVGDDRKHASAFEHCATPMKDELIVFPQGWHNCVGEGSVNVVDCPETWEPGVTHMSRDHNLWSGNLKGFIQYRKLIPGENYVGEY